MSGDPHGKLCCSFCGKAERDVVTLIAGPGVFICDECTELCSDMCRARREGDLDSRARAESAEWLGRITALRWIVEALSSGDATMDKPIRGPWSMRVQGDLSDGSVRIVLRRESKDDGDISIAFTETAHDLVDIAAWVAAARSGAIPSRAVDKWVEEGVEMTLSISAKALLREHERIAEQLRLEELLRSPAVESDRPLPLDVDLLRLAVARIIERNPDHRRHIARVLRDFVNELTSVR